MTHYINENIRKHSPAMWNSLVTKLQNVPPMGSGMMGQSKAAKSADFNATIGSSFKDGAFWVLDGLDDFFPAKGLPYGDFSGTEAIESWNTFIAELCENPTESSLVGPQNGIPTHGIAEALDLIAGAFLAPGDPIIMPDQTWPNIHNLFVKWYQATPYVFDFYDTNSFNVNGLKASISQARAAGHKKAMVVFEFTDQSKWICLTQTGFN